MTTLLKQSCYFCDQMERANYIGSYTFILYIGVPLNLQNKPKIDLRHTVAGTSRCVFVANRRFERYDNTAAQSNE